jgi:hypothetical protein
MIEAKFASTPQAQETRTLIREGHIRTVSVAFLTDKSKKSGEPRRELLNVGIVAIPSNRDAVIVGSKDASQLRQMVKAAGGDMALIQAIHDAACHLGADCVEEMVEPVDDPEEESREKSVEVVEAKSADQLDIVVDVSEVGESADLASIDDFEAALESMFEVSGLTGHPWSRPLSKPPQKRILCPLSTPPTKPLMPWRRGLA